MIAVVVWGAAIVAFGLSDTLWLSLAMLTLAGAGDMVSGIFRMTILQAAVDDSMRGRLDGIGMAVWATGPSLGDLESGVVASHLERAGERGVRRPAHHPRHGRAPAAGAGVRPVRRAPIRWPET